MLRPMHGRPGDLPIDDSTGLTEAQVRERLASEGPNVLPAGRRRTMFGVVGDVVREPMFGLLLAAGALYALIGDAAEALMLLLFATISVSIAVIQRGRSERVLEALQDLTSPRALVIREGERRRVAGRDVVRGDLLVLAEGDRVAADARVLSGSDLRLAEALLTGESMPVRKEPAAAASGPGSTEDMSMVYSGTLVVGGGGIGRVVATGARTQLGRLGAAMRDIRPEVPRLQAQTRRLVVGFAMVGAAVSVAAVLLYGVLRGDWIEALLGGIALGMAMLPEEFPLVLTVFMVMGAWRLSQSRVLTRRATAIETLGAATVLCTDKTGTLTVNAMRVVRLEAAAHGWTAEAGASAIGATTALAGLLDTAVRASQAQGHDPMDAALVALAASAGAGTAACRLVQVYPLRRELLAVTQVWEAPDATRVAAAKGAPEAVAQLCRLDAAARTQLMQRVDALAREGIRVLAVARGNVEAGALPADVSDLRFSLCGLVGFADPLRDAVPAAVQECRAAGIRVVMITGDYPLTAQAIAAAAGLDPGDCVTGQDVEQMTAEQLAGRIRSVAVFARISPAQKLRIVNALKAGGEVVAMTGDGVNDAAALKAAHIGIAMGGRGTDVAREASSLVLLDDDFGSIVRAIRLGRRIYDNLRKAMSYILGVHVPIAGLALLPVLTGAPLVLTPLLIALMELIIDPTCSIVFEAEHAEPDVMRRPPRGPRESIISPQLAAWSLLQGLLAFAMVATVYLHARGSGLPEAAVRMSAFLALVGASFALLMANRGYGASMGSVLRRFNPALLIAGGAATAVALLLLNWPLVGRFFGVASPGVESAVLVAVASLGLLGVLQATKRLRISTHFARGGD